jgi:hypothetical protein
MTILILTPIWGRPEIVKLFLAGFQRLRNVYPKLILVCIVSPEDKYHDYLIDMIEDVNGEVCEYSNTWLGEKKNFGLDFALTEFRFKYLMELNSDSLVNPDIFKLYKTFMECREPVFGINNLYAYEYSSGKCIFLKDYNDNHPLGPCRMYRYETLLEVLNVHKKKLWPKLNDSMDAMSVRTLKSCGIRPAVIDIGENPYLLDVKTNTNIWHFIHCQKFKEKDVDFETISDKFGIQIYDKWILRLNDFNGFSQYIKSFEDMGMTSKKSYEETENIYKMYYGKYKYLSYDAFRKVRSRQCNNTL